MKDLRKKFYQMYQLDWLIQHGHSLEELIDGIHQWRENAIENGDAQPEVSIKTVFENWLEESAFGGECFACFEEFMTHEYLDISYMFSLLNDKDFEQYAHLRGLEVGTYTTVFDDTTFITTKCVVDNETNKIVFVEVFGDGETGVDMDGVITNRYVEIQGRKYKVGNIDDVEVIMKEKDE